MISNPDHYDLLSDYDYDINQLKSGQELYFSFPVIHNYGCWCHGGSRWPGEREMKGSGPAIDDYDFACKAHAKGYECVVWLVKLNGIYFQNRIQLT